jgi:hypothetical protein
LKYNFSSFLLLQFAKIGLIAGDRQDSEETIVSLSGVLETAMEGLEVMEESEEEESEEEEDDSAEEQVCVNLNKDEETFLLNGRNCASFSDSDLVRGVEDIFRQECDRSDDAGGIIKHGDNTDKDVNCSDVDHNSWKCEFEIKI